MSSTNTVSAFANLIASGSAGLIPLVTYNWNPSSQLAAFLEAERAVMVGAPGAQASIIAVGDSTTLGFGSAPANYRPTASYPADLAAFLSQDGVRAQGDNFIGQGNELGTTTDARVQLLGGATWGFPIVAGGELVAATGTGQGFSFTAAAPAAYDRVTLSYLDLGSGTVDVSIDGSPVLTALHFGNTGKMLTQTVNLPTGLHANVTVTTTGGNPAYLQGASFWNSQMPSVQVYDGGVGGATSSIVGNGSGAGADAISGAVALKPTLALINFGINDILQGNLTAAQTTANIELMVNEFRAGGTDPVIVVPQPISSPNYTTEIAGLRASIHALADTLNLPVIDLSASYNDDWTALANAGLMSDYAHPNAKLYAAIASGIAGLLTAPLTSRTGSATASVSAPPGVIAPTASSVLTTVPSGSVSAERASDFIAAMGVTTHIPYTDGGYANLTNIGSDLSYLGLVNVRDGISSGVGGSAPLSSYITLAQQGVRFTFIVDGGQVTTASLEANLTLIDQVNTAVPGSVIAVEGPNEINNFPVTYNGVTGMQGALDLQKDLYRFVHSDPSLAGVKVDYFTGYDLSGPDPSKTPGYADYDTQHPYPRYGQAPAVWVSRQQALTNETASAGPAVYTETGYSTNSGSNAVAPSVQARYLLDLYMDTAKQSVSRTYVYQLMDAYKPGSPQGDDGFGLFDPNNVPKASAVAVHNLTTILADTGTGAGTFTPATLNYAISGLPSTGNSFLIAKSNGAFAISIWNEETIWNNNTGQAIQPVSVSTTVNLSRTYQTVNVFDPLSGTSPLSTLHNVSQVSVSLTDHPVIVEVEPDATIPTPPPTTVATAATTATIGSGPDTLAFFISEDAYQGDAQFTISVDGQQIGGVQTVTAGHGAQNFGTSGTSAADQEFDVKGSFGTGTHTATVSFLNDKWDGTAQTSTNHTDRNLYVDKTTLDGSLVPGSALTELWNGPQSFTFQAPVSAAIQAPTATPAATEDVALHLAEDAYLGDAQYSVSIDSGPASAPGTVTSSNAAHQSQLVDLGQLVQGTHDVAVSFLNDLYAGTPTTDRNLYVTGVDVGGTPVPNATASIMGDWTVHLTVVVPAIGGKG